MKPFASFLSLLLLLLLLAIFSNASYLRRRLQVDQNDGICSKYISTGWHHGTYQVMLSPGDSPNGIAWTWRECAKECALSSVCEFWTLETTGDGKCLLMSNQQGVVYVDDTTNHVEQGDKDADCLNEEPGAWTFVWSDEFDGPEIDPNVWGYERGNVRNNEAQYYTSRLENSRIDNGHMLIDAREDDWHGHQYTSASRTTRGKKSFLYGRFSIRAKIDVRSGSWPAWWWLPDTGGWPLGGEIDMMEYYQHMLLFNVMDGTETWSQVNQSLDNFGANDFCNHFHTWTLEWSAEKIKLYLDGVLMNDYNVSNADGTGPNGENPFRRPGYVLLNQAIGGASGGDPSGTKFPVRFCIDWIRQWEWNATATGILISVTNGAGSGSFVEGTKATIVAGQPPFGMIFDSWIIEQGQDVVLDYPTWSHTTLTVPPSGAIVTATYVPAFLRMERPLPSPSYGSNEAMLAAGNPHDGSAWTWRECAIECALSRLCDVWTLQETGDRHCLLISNRGAYVDFMNMRKVTKTWIL